MEGFNITPFLYEEDETLTFLYEECEKVFDSVLSSIPEAEGLIREEGIDPVDLLARLNRNIDQENRNQISLYYTEADHLLARAINLVPEDRQDLRWLLNSINDLAGSGRRDDTVHAMCFFHNAVKALYQFFGLCVSSKNGEIKRILVEKACERLGQSADNLITDAVKYAMSIPAGLPQIIPAMWQNVINSYTLNQNDMRHYRFLYPSRLRIGISFADLAYGEVSGQTDGYTIRELSPLSVQVGKHRLNGVIDLPGNLRVVLCAYRNRNDRVAICFRGTINLRNWLTNITQYAICDDYVYHMALGVVLLMAEQYKDLPIDVYGHSLGGGLTQFAVACADMNNVRGYGYNSAGLSRLTINRMPQHKNQIDICHYHLRNDVVFNIGHHVGQTLNSHCYFDTGASLDLITKIHSVEMLRIILECSRYWKLKRN